MVFRASFTNDRIRERAFFFGTRLPSHKDKPNQDFTISEAYNIDGSPVRVINFATQVSDRVFIDF